jgi:hypothetical protein
MDIKKIEKLMAELSEGSNLLIANPKNIEELEIQGVPFKRTPPQSIEQLFESRRKYANEKASNFPPLPPKPEPAMEALYMEIMECILFGLNGAAITLSAILIEYALKHTTFIKESGGYQKTDQSRWDKFEEMNLNDAIKCAKGAGLIDDEWAEKLHSFRDTIRNPYAHLNIKKITKGVIARKVKRLNLTTEKIEVVDIPAKDNPTIQALAKPKMDEDYVFPVFYFANEVVTHLLLKIEE